MLLEENSEVSEFRFCPVPKIENLEISESVLSLRILTVVLTSVAKTTKN